MSSYKNVNSDYTLTCDNGNGRFTVNAITAFQGNVAFNGNVTYIVPATNESAFYTAAANNTGAITAMGLLGQTGPNTFAGLKFDSTVNAWQTSTSVTSTGVPISPYANIGGSGSTAAGSNTQIQFNQAGAFGASTNLVYDYANSRLTLQGTEIFGNIGATPSYSGNGVAVYNNTVGGGGTGLYVKNATVNDELVSKSKAIVYAIIF
jgi:hypothetical protein